MDKIKVIFDVTIIANVRNNIKSGIFSVAKALLIEFMQKEEIELKLFCRENDRDLVWKNLKTYANAHNLPCEFESDIVLPAPFYKRLAKKFLSLLPQSFAHRLTILIKKFIPKDKNLNSTYAEKNIKKISNDEFFFSPIFAVPHKYRNINNCIFIHDTIPLIFTEYKNSPDNAWFFELCKSLGTDDICFANSAYTKTDFLKYLPHLKPENIIVTPLACDERFKPANADEIAKARKKYNIPENKKYIFSLCTLEPRKNLIRAVKCFANFISKNNIDDLVFVLGGAHWDAFIEKLENEIGSLDENIKSKILKIGYVDDSDQAALYSGALFFVYTSQYEGFGLPPLEAMSCGTPVITSNNSSLPEVVGQAAIMIDYDDDGAHIKAYESYYYNENLRQENSKKGLERAKLFSWEKCADIMITEMKRRAGL